MRLQKHSCLHACPQAVDSELHRAHTPEYVTRVDMLYRPGEALNEEGDLAQIIGDALIISGDVSGDTVAQRLTQRPCILATSCLLAAGSL